MKALLNSNFAKRRGPIGRVGARNDRGQAEVRSNMSELGEVDEFARELALTRYGLPLCLHLAIAARNLKAIERFVGRLELALTASGDQRAFLVKAYELPAPDLGLPIWQQPGATVLRQQAQVWVHVDDRQYRKAYAKAFPEQNISNLVLDHVMNRRVARLKGFSYLRIVPITRAANSSSGALSEKWAVAYHSSPRMVAKNQQTKPFIQYADLADIVKMLSFKAGGSLQEAVNEAQAWISVSK